MKHIILTVGLRQGILKNRYWRIVPSFDLEEAGRVAARRGLSLVLTALDYSKESVKAFFEQVRTLQDVPVIALGNTDADYGWPVRQEADLFLPQSTPSWQIASYVSAILQASGNLGSFLQPDPTEGWPIRQGDFFLDRINCWASIQGKVVYLREEETSLLAFFLMHTHMALSHRRVNYWIQLNSYGADEYRLVARLRDKIEPDPAAPVYIQSLPELGYCFYDTSDHM